MIEEYPKFIFALVQFLQNAKFRPSGLEYKKYVELGINTPCSSEENNSYLYRNNFKLVAPLFETAHAVDLDPACLEYIKDVKNLVWHNMTTDEFIENKMPKIGKVDFVFIDACHTFEASMKDFIGMAPYVRDNGIVLLHDSHPPKLKFIRKDGNLSGEVYKTADAIRNDPEIRKNWEIVTIPVDFGVSILRKADRQLVI